MDDDTNLIVSLTGFAEQGQWEEFLSKLSEQNSEQNISIITDDIVNLLVSSITKNKNNENERIQKCLDQVALKGSPKLLVLSSLENISKEGLNNEMGRNRFFILIRTLEIGLERIQDPKLKIKQWSFAMNNLVSLLQMLNIPSFNDKESQERLAMDESDPEYRNALDVTRRFAQFMSKSCQLDPKLLVAVFDTPLSFCNMRLDENNIGLIPRARTRARELVDILIRHWPDFFSLLMDQLDSDDLQVGTQFGGDNDKVSNFSSRGIATLFYFLFSTKNADVTIPQCYHPNFLFQKCIQPISVLIHSQDHCHNFKGLEMLQKLLENISDRSLSRDFVDIGEKMFEDLTYLITANKLVELRQLSFQIFELFHQKLELSARKWFYLAVHQNPSSPPGLRGWIVTLLKDSVLENMRSDRKCDHFQHGSLQDLFQTFFALKNGLEVDLVEEKEHVLAVLNCYGCLLMAEQKDDSKFGIRDFKPRFEESYASKLKESLDITTKHYNQNIQLCKEGKDQRKSNILDVPEMTKAEKLNVLSNGLNVLDMMRFSLSRCDL